MAFTRKVAGEIIEVTDLNQLIEAWEGDAASGEPLNLTEVTHETKYGLDVRNKHATGGLIGRFRNHLNVVLLELLENSLAIGKNVTCTAGVTLDGVDVGAHVHTGAAGDGEIISHTALSSIGTMTHAELETVLGAAGTMPIGGIIMWSGAVVDIPVGWALCNGTGGTPDLRGKFVIGAGGAYAVAAAGGAATVNANHTHAISIPTNAAGTHAHNMPAIYATSYQIGSPGNHGGLISYTDSNTDTAGAHSHTAAGTSNASTTLTTLATLPPYYALCYIMHITV